MPCAYPKQMYVTYKTSTYLVQKYIVERDSRLKIWSDIRRLLR